MNMTDLEKQLDDLKQVNRQKETALRKEIAKRKRQEEEELVKAVGKLALKTFPKCKSENAFEQFFKLIVSKRHEIYPEQPQAKPVFPQQVNPRA